MVKIDETGHVEITEPLCHWCDGSLDGESVNGMHETCAAEMQHGLDFVFGNQNENQTS
jgi:hypothetical protein